MEVCLLEKQAHPYIPNSPKKIRDDLLREIGVSSVDELYSDVPKELFNRKKLKLPKTHNEYEVFKEVRNILKKNKTVLDMPTFLGAGVWPHYVPAAVKTIISRGEFLTSYTPYQAEISQGMLQALFEYQSLIAELLEMPVVNASMYDWASALGEAALMAKRLTKKNVFLVPRIIHPERLSTLKTYAEPASIKVIQIEFNKDTGQLDLNDLESKLSKFRGNVAGVYIENPSYLGFLETQVDKISEMAHENEALFVVGIDPISLGVIRPPGDYGADIVVGEGQPLGNPLNFGGPLLGIFATKDDMKFIRQMPGRLIGMTRSEDGKYRGFVMTLQTREQHIRRERATSNICSNEALCAVAAAIYLSLLGKRGIVELGKTILYNSHYAMKKLNDIDGVKAPYFNAPHFKEFLAMFHREGIRVEDIHKGLLSRGIHGGKIVKKEFPEFGESMLFCVTEIHTKRDIDMLASVIREIVEEGG